MDRRTNGQSIGMTLRQNDIQTKRHIKRQAGMGIYIQTDKQIADRRIDRQKDSEQSDKKTEKQKDELINRGTETRTDRQANI
jgi:hypothetical protein